MPNGKTHTRATVRLSILLTVSSILYVPQLSVASLFLIPGCLLGILVTPDLDVDDGSYSYYLIRKHLGRFPCWLWKMFWLIYARSIPHRSILSHGPIIGTMIRVIYIIILTGGCCLLAPTLFNTTPVWFFIGGLALADLLHELMDAFS